MVAKKVILSKKISGEDYYLLPKTSADIVVFEDGVSVKEKLEELENTSVTNEIVEEVVGQTIHKTIASATIDGGEI